MHYQSGCADKRIKVDIPALQMTSDCFVYVLHYTDFVCGGGGRKAGSFPIMPSINAFNKSPKSFV